MSNEIKIDTSKFKPQPKFQPKEVQAVHIMEQDIERRLLEHVVGAQLPPDMTLEQIRMLSQADLAEGKMFSAFITQDQDMLYMKERARMYSKGRETVLITGESGVGKELIARIIGGYATEERPFVALNCAGFTDDLLASQLYGYVKGAFTGAMKNTEGHISSAKKGTLFLDEIGDMPMSQQAKLLRLLQSREYYPVGSTEAMTMECRVVCATNVDLIEAVKRGTFRQDLYWRICALHLHITPLRTRPADARLIAWAKADKHNDPQGADYVHPFTEEELENIPHSLGNVREIENYIITRRYEYKYKSKSAGR